MQIGTGVTGAAEGGSDDALLPAAGRSGDAVTATILPDKTAAHRRVRRRGVIGTILGPAQHDGAHALAPADTATGLRERPATSVGCRQTRLGVEDRQDRREHQVHSGHNRQIAFACPQRTGREMHRREGRRARRVHRHARARQVQRVRNPVGQHAVAITDTALRCHPGIVGQMQRAPIAGHHTDKHTGGRAAQRLGVYSGVLECVVAGL
ncbi:Uncharacterised protein [Mycobacteroides abscessus subsp. abscessus]|nr:Uncharacterised protein [Mycobacteroides abscessus subsp. abscessus]